jgi:hypothetical protein
MQIFKTTNQVWFKYLIGLCCVLQVLDWHSTFMFHEIKGERNVLLLGLADWVGFVPALTLFKAVALGISLLLYKLRMNHATIIDVLLVGGICFAYSVVVTRNYFS